MRRGFIFFLSLNDVLFPLVSLLIAHSVHISLNHHFFIFIFIFYSPVLLSPNDQLDLSQSYHLLLASGIIILVQTRSHSQGETFDQFLALQKNGAKFLFFFYNSEKKYL